MNTKNIELEDSAIPNLCAAIVEQAIEDYTEARKGLPEAIKNHESHRAAFFRKRIADCVSFFKSDYCSRLLGDRFSGEDILRRINAKGEWRLTDGFGILR